MKIWRKYLKLFPELTVQMEAINRDIQLYAVENGLVEIDRSAPVVSVAMCVGERGYVSRLYAIAVTSTFVKKTEMS